MSQDDSSGKELTVSSKRGLRFWLVILSVSVCMFLTALELTAVSTALPVIINDLHGSQFIWVGSAYALAATAFLPMSGGLAQIFGRRLVMLAAVLAFALGSALCGAATSLSFLIAGRTVQGLGGGGMASLTSIIISDLVPLRERGAFNGLVGIAWSLASGVGPVVGGSLATKGQWRWIFYLNIPICGFAAVLILCFLNLRTPRGTMKEKFERLDWIGNFIVVASTTACVIALTWAGIQFPWKSFHILVPLILGLCGLVAAIIYEAIVPKHPMIPFSLISTVTGASGYIQTFIMPIVLLGLVYYLPVYFQACKLASPTASGVDCFGLAFSVAPSGIIGGITVATSKKYRPQMWISWILIIIGCGLLSTLNADSPRSSAIGFQIIVGVGLGVISTTTYFPVLAPLPTSSNANALAFFTFLRNFAQIWGVTIGGTILQNQLTKRLPVEFNAVFSQGTPIAYAVIPAIKTLEEPLRTQVQNAFAESIKVIWQVLIGVGGLGLLVSLPMKSLPLHTSLDREWGMEMEEPGSKTEDGDVGKNSDSKMITVPSV